MLVPRRLELPGRYVLAKADEIRAPLRLEGELEEALDRKSTRLNSSHVSISYAVFCLKNKNLPPVARRVDARHNPDARVVPPPHQLVALAPHVLRTPLLSLPGVLDPIAYADRP